MNLLTLKSSSRFYGTGIFLLLQKKITAHNLQLVFTLKISEEFLGVQLFEKTGRYLRPTAVVQKILPDIKVILDAYSSLEKFKFKERELIGTLKVGF